MGYFFETDRLYLNPIGENELNGDYPNWFNDSTVCEFNSHCRLPYSREKCAAYVRMVSDSENTMVMAIFTKENGNHIGNISLQSINYIDRSAEIAWLIGDCQYWGKGYATEAAEPIIEHAFNNLNLHRLYLGTADNNLGMQKVAMKLGFVKEGVRREALFKNGSYHDVYEYGLIRKGL